MLDGLTVGESLHLEIEKVRAMDKQKRWEYFKTYYLVKTLVGLGVLLVLLHLIYSIWLGGRECLTSGCLINVEISEEGVVFLTDNFVSYCGKTKKDSVANVSLGNTFDFFSENPLDNNAYEMALLTQLSAGEYQYMIIDETGLERFAKLDIYIDLQEMLTDSQREALADRVIYQSLQDGKEKTAVALSLSDTEFAKKVHLEPENAYLVFVDVNPDIEKNRKFLEYLLGSY